MYLQGCWLCHCADIKIQNMQLHFVEFFNAKLENKDVKTLSSGGNEVTVYFEYHFTSIFFSLENFSRHVWTSKCFLVLYFCITMVTLWFSIQDKLYRFMESRYLVKDIMFLCNFDFISAVVEYSDQDRVRLVLCISYTGMYKYVMKWVVM